ncbi:O-antigen ligase domain-containing protein, partial [Clostridium perfringens]
MLHAAVPAAMLAAALGAALAFAGLRERLYSAATWLARGEMYADALRLLREWPWLGRGGDTWRWLHRTVQSRPYVGNEVHSGYLDLALDLGGIGLLALLVWLGFAVVRMRRSRMPGRLLPAFLVLLLHSAVDFDMSYGLYWMLVLWLAVWGLGPSGGSFGRRPG